jgi:hypothetical protein
MAKQPPVPRGLPAQQGSQSSANLRNALASERQNVVIGKQTQSEPSIIKAAPQVLTQKPIGTGKKE